MAGFGPQRPVVPPRASSPAGQRRDQGPDRRALLLRDSVTILVGVGLALFAGNLFLPQTGPATAVATELPSAIELGSPMPPVTLAPPGTLGPVVNPSLGLDATPTPPPFVTTPPDTPSPSPSDSESASASPSTSPSKTPKPTATPKPSPSHTATPTASPTSTPAPTATPQPSAAFTWTESSPCVVDFTNTSTGDTSWSWDFGDLGMSSSQNPSHTYLLAGDYTVQLTINGGADSISKTVTVAGPCP